MFPPLAIQGLPFKSTPIPEIKKHKKKTYSQKASASATAPLGLALACALPRILFHIKLQVSCKDETFSS